MKKNIFVLNPISGRSNTKKIFDKYNFIIKENDLILFTKKKHEAIHYLSNINLENIDKIIGVGGDGTIQEIIEGLILNSTFNKTNTCIAHIPTGTGNGLAASVQFLNNQKFNIINSIKSLSRKEKKIQSMNLAKIESKYNKYNSFLSFGIGFISNLDINTEFLRFLGSFRFYLGAIYELFFMKSYKLKISYSLKKNNKQINYDSEIPKNWKTIVGNYVMLWSCNLSHPSWDVFISDEIKFDDSLHHIILIENTITRWEMLNILLNLDNGMILNNKNVIYIKTNQYRVEIEDKNALINIDGEQVINETYHINVGYQNIDVLI